MESLEVKLLQEVPSYKTTYHGTYNHETALAVFVGSVCREVTAYKCLQYLLQDERPTQRASGKTFMSMKHHNSMKIVLC